MIDSLIFGSKTVHFLWIASNICLSMLIKTITKQCVTTSQDTTTSNFTPAVELTLASKGGGGWYFVSVCIPFGCKSSAYIYHTTGLVASPRLRSWNIPSSLNIDDRHNGQLSFSGGTLPPAYQTLASSDEVNFALALAGIFLTCYILTSLGYFIGLVESKFTPQKQVPFLGFVIDSERQAFTLLPHKKVSSSRQKTLPRDNLNLLTLQGLSGKCMSMSLAVPGARLYVNEII